LVVSPRSLASCRWSHLSILSVAYQTHATEQYFHSRAAINPAWLASPGRPDEGVWAYVSCARHKEFRQNRVMRRALGVSLANEQGLTTNDGFAEDRGLTTTSLAACGEAAAMGIGHAQVLVRINGSVVDADFIVEVRAG
jgi:hypothetical protein